MPDINQCKTWLRQLLENGPVRSNVVLKHGAREGFSTDQLRRARIAIGAKFYKVHHAERGRGKWFWELTPPSELLNSALDDIHRMRLRLDRIGRQIKRAIQHE